MNKTILAALAIALSVPAGVAQAEQMDDNAMSSNNTMSQGATEQNTAANTMSADDDAMSDKDMTHDQKMQGAKAHNNNGLRPQKSESGVKYITGGTGNKSQKMLEKHADQYSLHLVTVSGEAYVSNAHIQVMDAANDTVLDTMVDAPMLYADLEPGTYVIKATLDDESETRKVTIADSGSQTVRLSFPDAD